jgi:uncharacterized protein YeaO (DUF488 family)
MPITTSYFAVCKKSKGTNISIARFVHPRIASNIDERMPAFAPSPELLKDYKDGKATWTQYVLRYSAEQAQHYKEKPEDFHILLQRAEKETLVLICYEKYEGLDKTLCHRLLLVDMLKEIAQNKGYEVEFIAEDFPESAKSPT